MFDMEKEIKTLNEQISTSINEIAKDFEMKYRDFVPSFLGVADSQQKIQHTINDGNEQLKKLETQLANVEKAVEKAQDESPHKKRDTIKEFLDALNVLSEMEHCLNQLWMLPSDENATDPLCSVRLITRLDELYKTLESETANNLEAVNERILPLMFTEIQEKKSDLGCQLQHFYKNFLRFIDNDRISPPMVGMTLSIPHQQLASDSFSAMQRLGSFDEHLEAFVDAIWEQFCLKLIYADEKSEHLMKISVDRMAKGAMCFEIKKEVQTTKKPDPTNVFSGLTKLFEGLHQALHGIRVEDRFLVDIFGHSIAQQLISSLEKGCLNPAIPFEKTKAAIVYTELTKLTQDFLQFMKEQGFFTQPVDNLFENFFNSFERISVDRRCHHFITASRDLIKQPYIELIEVGQATDEQEEKAGEILDKMQDKFKISADNENLSTSAHWDKYHTKLFQFQRCKISQSTFKLHNLVQEVLRAAAEADTELEACRLVITARNILEMFTTTAPEYHKQALTSDPQIAAIFFNNCHYICHRLMTLPNDVMKNIMKVSKISQQNCTFTDMFTQLRTLASDHLELHIVNARRQISTTIGDKDIFNELRDERAHKRCQKALHAAIMQIEQTANVWTEVMSSYILAQSLGELVSHLMTVLADIILRKEDITSSDAEVTSELLSQLIDRLERIMTIDAKPMIQKMCEEPYNRLSEIIFCLKGSLAEIGHRWCEGKGPLALWLNASQMKQLIRAIFQNTDRRAQLLAQIN